MLDFEQPIDPTCIWCGKKWSEHKDIGYEGRGCLRCSICYDALTPETCAVDEDGVKWDICIPCKIMEDKCCER